MLYRSPVVTFMLTSKRNGGDLQQEVNITRIEMDSLFPLVGISLLICFPLSVHTEISTLEVKELMHWIEHKQWDTPICVLFVAERQFDPFRVAKNSLSLLKLGKAMKSLKKKGKCVSWEFRQMVINQNIPNSKIVLTTSGRTLKCYLGTAAAMEYTGDVPVKQWLNNMDLFHAKRLEVISTNDIVRFFQRNLSTEIYIIVFLGNLYFELVEEVLIKVRDQCKLYCQLVVAIPETQIERDLAEKYNINNYPTALIFHRKRRGLMPVLKKRLESIHDIDELNILQNLLMIRSRAVIFKLDNFASNALNIGRKKPPVIACFFSSKNPSLSYPFLHAFERSQKEFVDQDQTRNKILFGLVDVSNAEDANIISRYLDVAEIRRIPFIAVFWQESAASAPRDDVTKFITNQKVYSNLMPTPWNLKVILQDLRIINDKDEISTRVGHKFDLFCSVNSTDTCGLGDRPVIYFGPNLDPSYRPKKPRKKVSLFRKVMGIPLLTDHLWPRIIEQSASVPGFSNDLLKRQQSGSKIKLVIFIMADCGYCEIMMPSFSDLAKSARKMHGVSVYLMNCTASPVYCKKNGVNGYPILALFRAVSEEESRQCLMNDSTLTSARIDYHGNLQIDDILSWLSKAAMSAININIKSSVIPDMKADVRLTAHLYTKKQALKYLPRSLHRKLIPLQCFKFACEKLFGFVECIAIKSSDVELEKDWNGGIKEKDLVIEQVTFNRIDGATTKIFKLAYPMEKTLNDPSNVILHRFHRKHRYSIPSGFRCENNLPLCTDIMVKFVEDHRRLTITHINRETFHRHGSSSSIFSKEFPLLIALAHKTNITGNSTFLQELEKAAKNLYTKVMFATLNVDEFPSWASQFVPRDYHYKNHDIQDRVPALFHYPRICIIDWNDHQHAAFYPPVEDLEKVTDIRKRLSSIKAEDVIAFSEKYIRDKESVAIETEMF